MLTNGDEINECGRPMVRLIIGEEKKQFDLDQNLLCEYCPFFANTFLGNFIEAQTKTLTLPDDEPERFEELAQWLNSDTVSISCTDRSWRNLSVMWLFGNKYHIDAFQNAVINAIYQKFAAHEEGINISYETLDFIAEQTSDNPRSPLRRIFADMLTNGVPLQQLSTRVDQIPAEFLQDMLIALKQTIHTNGPTNISLLTYPVPSYYSSSNCKTNARPASPPPVEEQSSGIYCDGWACSRNEPPETIRGMMHVCTNHNLTLCHECRHSAHGHRKKLFTFTTAPHRDSVTGDCLIVDGHINDSGFYCDGPKCDPETKRTNQENWALMSGDRYHCLECDNVDYCSVCVRGELACKDAGHSLLRIRPTYAKFTPLTEEISIKQRQERAARKACWRCGSEEHTTTDCEAKPVMAKDVDVED